MLTSQRDLVMLSTVETVVQRFETIRNRSNEDQPIEQRDLIGIRRYDRTSRRMSLVLDASISMSLTCQRQDLQLQLFFDSSVIDEQRMFLEELSERHLCPLFTGRGY